MVTRDLPEISLAVNYNLSGLGDVVSGLSVLNSLFNNTYPKMNLTVYSYFSSFLKYIFPKERFSPWEEIFKSPFMEKTAWRGLQAYLPYPTTLRMHTSSYLSVTLLDKLLDITALNYPTVPRSGDVDHLLDRIGSSSFAIVPVGETQITKRLPEHSLEEIVSTLAFYGITPVFVGKNYRISDHIKSSAHVSPLLKGVNLVDQTTELELLSLIWQSKLVIGMDGGTIHLAGLTDRPIVVAYTIARPEHKMPIRNNLVGYNCWVVGAEEALACRHCQDTLYAVPGFDSSRCYFGDYACAPQPGAFTRKIHEALTSFYGA